MKTAHAIKGMKIRIHAVLLGMVCSFAVANVSHAMSELASITVEPQWPTTTQPGTVTLYKVTVTRAGQGLLDVSLTGQGLPEGATASFSTNRLRFTGRAPVSLTVTLAISCTNVTATDLYPFIVTGEAAHSSLAVTNQTSKNSHDTRIAVPPVGPMLALEQLADGSIKLRGEGVGGATCQIETTADLTHPNWTAIGSSTADGNGRFIFAESPAKDSSARFYRTASATANP
jgi:hypothetical protein